MKIVSILKTRYLIKGWRQLVFLMVLVGWSIPVPARAVTIPSGFYLVAEDTGVKCYRKDYSGGQPDYVLVVDLKQARCESRIGDVVDPGIGQGPLGGNNPRVNRLSLS